MIFIKHFLQFSRVVRNSVCVQHKYLREYFSFTQHHKVKENANRRILHCEFANVILEQSEESFANSPLEDDGRLA